MGFVLLFLLTVGVGVWRFVLFVMWFRFLLVVGFLLLGLCWFFMRVVVW